MAAAAAAARMAASVGTSYQPPALPPAPAPPLPTLSVSVTEADVETAALLYRGVCALPGAPPPEPTVFDAAISNILTGLSATLAVTPDPFLRHAASVTAKLDLLDLPLSALGRWAGSPGGPAGGPSGALPRLLLRLRGATRDATALYPALLRDATTVYASRVESWSTAAHNAQAEALALLSAGERLGLESDAATSALNGALARAESAEAEVASLRTRLAVLEAGHRPPPQPLPPSQGSRVNSISSNSGGGGGGGASSTRRGYSAPREVVERAPKPAPTSEPVELPALLSLIRYLTAAKVVGDAAAAAGTRVKETVEQCLYSHLAEVHGGDINAATKHAGLVIAGLNRYAPLHPEVAIYSSMLRCEVDEGLGKLARELASSAEAALGDALHSAFAGSGVDEAQLQQMRAKLLGEEAWAVPTPASLTSGGVEGALWERVVSDLYPRAMDADRLKTRIEVALVRHTLEAVGGGRGGGGKDGGGPAGWDARSRRVESVLAGLDAPARAALLRDANPHRRLPWPALLRELLMFTLEGHTRFLAKFRDAWRACDAAGAGWVSRAAFVRLCTGAMGLSPREAVEATGRADPWAHDRVTWSDAVAVLVAAARGGM